MRTTRRCSVCSEEIPAGDSCGTCGGRRCAICCYFAVELVEALAEYERETGRQVDEAFERLLEVAQ